MKKEGDKIEARIIHVENDREKEKLETDLIRDGYKRKDSDLVLNKNFIWLFFIGFGSIFFIYLFVVFIVLYIVYIIYYFKTREKDRVRIVSEGKTVPAEGSNVVNEGYSIPRPEIKKDPEREERKNQFTLVLGIGIIIASLIIWLFKGHLTGFFVISIVLLIIGLIPVIKGLYGLYVK